MGMQTDVLSGHLHSSGFTNLGRSRLKGFNTVGTPTAGYVILFDTDTAPVAVTYGRSGNTVTVTHNSHGYVTGDTVGLGFLDGTGGAATAGNYPIVVTGPNTYTLQDINSGTITAGASAWEAHRWLMAIDSNVANDYIYMLIPGEGILAYQGIYAVLNNQTSITVFYG